MSRETDVQHCPDARVGCSEQTNALDLSKRNPDLSSREHPARQICSSQLIPEKISLDSLIRKRKRALHVDDFSHTCSTGRQPKQIRTSHSRTNDDHPFVGRSPQLGNAVAVNDSFEQLSYVNDQSTVSDCEQVRLNPREEARRNVFKQGPLLEHYPQEQTSLLEQCLIRPKKKGDLNSRFCLEEVLQSHSCKTGADEYLRQNQDHTKLTIGQRTCLDKLCSKKEVLQYLEEAIEKRAGERFHSDSERGTRPKDGISAMMSNQESGWWGLEGLGFDVTTPRAEVINDYGMTQRQYMPCKPHIDNLDTCSSIFQQNDVRGGSDLATISFNDLCVLATEPQGSVLQHDLLSATTPSTSVHYVGSNSPTAPRDARLGDGEMKQPKNEFRADLSQCDRAHTSCSFPVHANSSSTSACISIAHTVEEYSSKEDRPPIKTEADSLKGDEDNAIQTGSLKRNQMGAKRPLDNKCPICTDVISGYHYGTYSCESCKGFFKRTIQNKRVERLMCEFGGKCLINLQNRKYCASCRFKKCLESGMKVQAVREDRQRGGRSMYEGSTEQKRRQYLQMQQQQKEASGQMKRRKPRTSKAPSTAIQPPNEAPPAMGQTSSEPASTSTLGMLRLSLGVEEHTISDSGVSSASSRTSTPTLKLPVSAPSVGTNQSPSVVHQHLQLLERLEATFFNPFGLPRISMALNNNEEGMLTGAYFLLEHFCKKMPTWTGMLPLVQDLELSDRQLLMQASWLQALMLTLCYRCHDDKGILILPDRSHCDVMALVETVSVLDIVRRMKQLAQKFHELKATKEEYFFLKLLLLLNPDVKNLAQPSRVRNYQEQVQEQLFELGAVREGSSSSLKLGELLLKLSELERLSQLVKEHLVFRQLSGKLGSGAYANLVNMLADY